MTDTQKPSRRLFLAAGSAGAVFGALGAAVAAEAQSADPIFAAIERHKAAWRAFLPTCDLTDEVLAEQQGRVVSEADEAAREAAGDAEIEALEALLETLPTTKAGARAALEYLLTFDQLSAPPAVWRFAGALLASPVLQSESLS